MERIFIPFTIAPTKDAPAEAVVNFTVQRAKNNFRVISLSRLKFMKLYEQSKYENLQHPFNQSWSEWQSYLDSERTRIAGGETVRNDLNFGHARNPELKALDDLPHIIEVELQRPQLNQDRVTTNINPQREYQTTSLTKKMFADNPKSIQSHLMYSTNLMHGEYGGWEGTISCNMSDVGFFSLSNNVVGNEFEMKVRMYNYKREQLSSMPAMEMNLLIR